MATINTARYFGLKRLGAVSPGYQADLVVFDSFEDLGIRQVYHMGQKVAEDGRYLFSPRETPHVQLRSSVNVNLLALEFKVRVPTVVSSFPRVKVIGVIPSQIVTRKLVEEIPVKGGFAVADSDRDLLKIAVVERHLASGNVSIGFVKGFGLRRGVIASSVAHDSHNIIVVGANDDDMTIAVIEVVRMRGGQVVVARNEVLAAVPLPIAGLMSDLPVEEMRYRVEEVAEAAHKLGCALPDPLMTLSFMALPVIPELKLTDKGLVDVQRFTIVPLFEMGEEEEGEEPVKRVALRVSVPWWRVPDLVRGVFSPLSREGAKMSVEVKIDAQSERGISRDTLDFKIKEMLNQIGAKILEEHEEREGKRSNRDA
jgi:adenine deaminase